MGFIRTFEEIMAMVGKRAEFYGAEMLTVTWETTPEIIKSLLPPPLKPAEKPIASAFVADYPRTNFSLPYKEAALFLLAEYHGVAGGYCLAMPVTYDMAMAGGREVFGYPKRWPKSTLTTRAILLRAGLSATVCGISRSKPN